MKVLPFKIPKPDKNAFVYQVDNEPIFFDKLHQHEEIQISLIAEGEGALIVGDTVNYYKKDDVLIIGSRLPHVFKSHQDGQQNSLMLSLFFARQSFGNGFFDLEELKELQRFFKRSRHGFKLLSKHQAVKKMFLQLEGASKFNQFLILMQMLKLLSSANFKSLSSFIYDKTYSDIEGNRMRDVFEFTMDHFENKITLEDVSNVANMTKNAFCKYFKKRTNKSYIQFLNELRIEHASNLLLSNNDLTIDEVAERCGFGNISNFNRQFKAIKKSNPSEYKKALKD